MRDNLFNHQTDIADFRFDKEVVEVFDDMVRRSVPGYDSMIQMIGLIARIYGQDNSNYYDLGSSTGAISLSIALNNKSTNCLLYTSPSPRDGLLSRMPSSA